MEAIGVLVRLKAWRDTGGGDIRMRYRCYHLVAVFLLGSPGLPFLSAQNWPTYRHDYQRSGHRDAAVTFPLHLQYPYQNLPHS